MHLPIDFSSTQTSSTPRVRTSILVLLSGNFFLLESLVEFEGINLLFFDPLIFVFVNICLVQNHCSLELVNYYFACFAYKEGLLQVF